MIKYRNELTRSLDHTLFNEGIKSKYVESGDKILDDEMIVWAGRKNGLKIIVCDSYLYGRDYFKVIKSYMKGDELVEIEVYNGSSISGVVSTVKRVMDSFKKRREFYFKNRVIKKG